MNLAENLVATQSFARRPTCVLTHESVRIAIFRKYTDENRVGVSERYSQFVFWRVILLKLSATKRYIRTYVGTPKSRSTDVRRRRREIARKPKKGERS